MLILVCNCVLDNMEFSLQKYTYRASRLTVVQQSWYDCTQVSLYLLPEDEKMIMKQMKNGAYRATQVCDCESLKPSSDIMLTILATCCQNSTKMYNILSFIMN